MKFKENDPDLPGPQYVLSVSWEDIYGQFKDRGIEPTKNQVIQAFEIAVDNFDNECMMNAFWANLDYAIDRVEDDED